MAERDIGKPLGDLQFQSGADIVEEEGDTLEKLQITTGNLLILTKKKVEVENPKVSCVVFTTVLPTFCTQVVSCSMDNSFAVQVDICFMVDCTGSMSNYIESVKDSVKVLRDQFDAEFSGPDRDMRFAFVRYTDYDQPASTRTTWIDFTTLVIL